MKYWARDFKYKCGLPKHLKYVAPCNIDIADCVVFPSDYV